MKRFLDKIMLLDLFAGLGITFRNMLKKNVTIQYPEARAEPAHRFPRHVPARRGPLHQVHLCARDCPIDIIYIDWHQEVNAVTEKKEKLLDRFDIDVQRCMFCGLCEEAVRPSRSRSG